MAAVGRVAAARALAAVGAERASAQIVARGVQNGMLALDPRGTPFVAYTRGQSAFVAGRGAKGSWRTVKVGAVFGGSRIMAFAVGPKGPVVLVQRMDGRNLVLIR